MKKNPSIAVIELNSVARGILAGDTMLKKSPVAMVRSGSVHNGKYLILIGGTVASVDEAYRAGVLAGGESTTDSIILPDVHHSVFEALFGKRKPCSDESLAIVETLSVPSVIQAAEAAVKGADVRIIEIRMADDLGGKGIVILSGRLEEVEAAVKVCREVLAHKDALNDITVIPRPDTETVQLINTSTHFRDSSPVMVRDGEK